MSNVKTSIIYVILVVVVTFGLSSPAVSFAQNLEDGNEVTESTIPDETTDAIEYSSVWELVGYAGNIQYPIIGILIIGLFLISLRSFELYKDNIRSAELQQTSFVDMPLDQINNKISNQSEFMLSSVMAKLLNVFQTNKKGEHLHNEISNYSRMQKDNFSTFRNRVDFLSDTAGALGLLGTVWGMFIVFSSGALEQEVILAGMGIALMSTLLGLVVSIVLNFCSTLTEGYFSKNLERITSKADELRFRLIELAEDYQKAMPTASSNNSNSNSKRAQTQSSVEYNKDNQRKKDNFNPVAEPKPKEEPSLPEKIVLSTKISEAEAGETIQDIKVQLLDTKGEPVRSEKLEILVDSEGKINGDENNSVIQTDADGYAKFNWEVDQNIGSVKALVRCQNSKYKDVKKVIPLNIKANKPSVLKLLNNHQAAAVESKLDKQIVAVVKDKYDNPVEGQSVKMELTLGDGKLENNVTEIMKKTNSDGQVFVDFKLGSTPGFNAVEVKVPDYKLSKTFQAVGQEITV